MRKSNTREKSGTGQAAHQPINVVDSYSALLGWMAFALVHQEQRQANQGNAAAKIKQICSSAHGHFQCMLKQCDDHDHNDDFSQPVLQIIQITDHQHLAGSLASACRVDIADKQFIEPQRKNQHDGCQQVAIHHFHNMRDALVMQQSACFIAQTGIRIVRHMLHHKKHVHSRDIKQSKPGRQTGKNRHQNDKSAIPQKAFEELFYELHLDNFLQQLKMAKFSIASLIIVSSIAMSTAIVLNWFHKAALNHKLAISPVDVITQHL